MTHFISRMLANPRHLFVGAIATLAIATTAITPAFAERKHKNKLANMSEQERLEHMENRLDKRMEKLTKELTLSDAQAKQVRAIFANAQTERMDIRARHSDDRKAAKPELKELRERTQNDLEQVLTSDQYAKLETMRAERKAKKQEHRKNRHAERATRRLEKLEKELGLSEKQVEQIKAIHADRKLKARAIIEDAGSREAAKPELKELRKATHQEIRGLLDATQQKKFDAMKKEHRQRRKNKHG